MTTLKERLDRISAGFAEKVPDAIKEVMHRATEDLRASGIMDRIPQPGTPLPPFELPDTGGSVVRSEDLLARGPLVVTFYRGLW